MAVSRWGWKGSCGRTLGTEGDGEVGGDDDDGAGDEQDGMA